MQKLTRPDWLFLSICAVVAALSSFVVFNWFTSAFPEASIEFRYDAKSSTAVAESVLKRLHVDTRGMKHTVTFEADDNSKIFLERSLGLKRANAVTKSDVRLWFWRHRWFRPLQEEELRVEIAPTGELVAFGDLIPENRPLPEIDETSGRQAAEAFLTGAGVRLDSLRFAGQSQRQLPHRLQRIYAWESVRVRPAGAPYRYEVTIDGNRVTDYSQRLKVPDAWQRGYQELRSRNLLAGNIDTVFLGLTIAAALIVFIRRLRRGDLPLRLLLSIAGVSIVLVTGVALNNYPSALAGYDTTSSFPSFLTFFALGAMVQGIGVAMFLTVIVGAGEVLYRERLPGQLAIPLLWNPKALASRRVFRSFILGYTLVGVFLAYQVIFYLVADRFGAWSPAEIPYDEILNSAFPWIAVLFAGFFPALSEEFMSRAFSIPLLERLLKSRVAAIILAGFIWGFGHATYPNQPFYIRGVEVGLGGVLIGFLFYRFGLLPLLIWHYTVDALYSALLLMRSGNRYYEVSGGLAALVFAVPMLITIVLYLRNGGFVPDDDLSNETLPINPQPEQPAPRRAAILPAAMRVTRRQLLLCITAVALALGIALVQPPSITEVIDYRVPQRQAKEIASRVVAALRNSESRFKSDAHILAVPVDGFRSWDATSGREEGGSPGGFDSVAADYLARHGMKTTALIDVFRHHVRAAMWNVRFFVPGLKEEYFVEVDPRTAEVTGYHKYQNETEPGPSLDRAVAESIARSALTAHGLNEEAFETREALTFQQPARRDWLFHLQERRPLAAEAFRRVTVRVAGQEVTQFAVTVKVPDEAYREAAKQTLLNSSLIIIRLLGMVAALSLIIAGFVIATRKRHLPWKRAARWTGLLAIIPIAAALSSREAALFNYTTSIQWNTFLTDNLVDTVRGVVIRIGVIFLALAGIDAAVPTAFTLLSREGRARFGRSAVVASITAVALAGVARAVLQLIAGYFPSMASIGAPGVPASVFQWAPFLIDDGEAILRAIGIAAAAALFSVSVRPLRKRAWLLTAGIIFCTLIESNVTPQQVPGMLLSAIAGALLVCVVARYVLGHNLLAWPLTVALALILQNAAFLLQNHRPDLQVSAYMELLSAVILLGWMVIPRMQPESEEPPLDA